MVKTTTDTKTARGLYLDYVKELIRDLKNSKDWKLTNKPTDPNNKFEFFTGTEEALIINSTDRTIRWVKQCFVKGLVHRVKNSMMVSGFIYFLDHPLTNQERKRFTFNDLIDLTVKSLSKDILKVDGERTGFHRQLIFFDDGNFSEMIKLVILDENNEIKDSDDRLLKIIKNYLLSKESTEYLLKEKEPGYLCDLLSSVSNISDKKGFSAIDKILEFFPKDVLLESLIYKSKSQDQFYNSTVRTSYGSTRLYEFLFVENKVDDVDDLRSLKLMFTKYFFRTKNKGNDQQVKYYKIHPELFLFLIELLSTNDLKDPENLKVFEDLKFCFEKALTFLDELEQEPILSIVSQHHEISNSYYFDLAVSPNVHLEEVNLLKQLFTKPLLHAKEATNIRFVFSQDSPELSLFYNGKYFENNLRHWGCNPGQYSDDFKDFSELLKNLEELFEIFYEVIKEKDRSELELLMLDLQRWKGKLVFFEKIKNNQLECFVP